MCQSRAGRAIASEIVRFAAEEFGIPIALLSLVDDNRQWFEARVGFAACATDRGIPFCGHAIVQPDILVRLGGNPQ